MSGHLRVGTDELPETADLLVVGLGVTGAGVALDAAARGLDVVAVEAHDLAFGTSRWSSKLVHGGLRYLARGQVAVAHESAVERGLLMQRTAPHLVRALPMLLPLTPHTPPGQAALVRAGMAGGDLLRRAAGTSRRTLPPPRRLSVAETLAHAPVVRREGLRGGVLSFDGQLVDDVRLVVALARTAAREGARLHTRTRVESIEAGTVRLRDARTGEARTLRARAVVNAAGVWAGALAPEVRLRPSRGTHLVLRGSALPGLRVAVMAPVPGAGNRYLFVLPQADGRLYLGLTDEETHEIPDVPEPTDAEVEFLLRTASQVLERPLDHADVAGAYAGLRPLLDAGGRTADLSRRHAVLAGADGTITVVGGKLTTYRRMAQDAVDAAITRHGLTAGPCRTRALPLVGSGATGPEDRRFAHLLTRFGSETAAVVADAVRRTGLDEATVTAPAHDEVAVCLAELLWGVTQEGAATVADLLERRTRVSLSGDCERALPLAEQALRLGAPALTTGAPGAGSPQGC